MQKHCFLSFPSHLSWAHWWIVYASIHLSCTFRPIIAPTWDSTQDNVGIFDNMDCENETLLWINKQYSLELLDWYSTVFLASSCIISSNIFSLSAPLSVILGAVLENALRLLDRDHALPPCCDFTEFWICNMDQVWKDGLNAWGMLHHSLGYVWLKASESQYHSQPLA